MTFRASLPQLADVLGVALAGFGDRSESVCATGVTTDSRQVGTGELFVALRGETFDGHAFVPQAIAKGAAAVVVERAIAVDPPGDRIPQLIVKNTLSAYQTLGQWWRKQFDIPVIAVTGSVGKTTTKELIAAMLGIRGKVLKSQANFNNEIGVPKTLLQLTADHRFAVVEMAMRGSGQIAELTHIAQPTIGVITNVGTAHIGLLGSREAIAQAKCELLADMPSEGIAILNYDHPLLMETAQRVWQGRGSTLTYGFSGGDIRGTLLDPDTLAVQANLQGQSQRSYQFPLPLAGQHNASNYLAALAVASVLGIDWAPFTQGLTVDMPAGRAKRLDLPNDIVFLDETYNAGLESMTAALHLLAQTPGDRRIAVVGTMKELGAHSLEFHETVGKLAGELRLDGLFVLADPPEAAAIVRGAASLCLVETFLATEDDARDRLTERLQASIQPGDRILFKASHSVALDRVVARLLPQFQDPIQGSIQDPTLAGTGTKS